jgi:hypothetical protein
VSDCKGKSFYSGFALIPSSDSGRFVFIPFTLPKGKSMKTLTLTVSDDSKFMLLVNLLRELHFVSIDNEPSDDKIKTMRRLPQSVLRPARAEQFKMFSRDELHAR